MTETKIPTFLNDRHDDEMIIILNNFSECLNILESDLDFALDAHEKHTLTNAEHIKLDTYLTYANSSLFWMYLKLRGNDLSKHYILHELGRSKDMLNREKQLIDSKSATRLDMAATNRFISAGLHKRFVNMDGIMVTEAQYKRSV